jgi:uncharacterized protein
MSVQLKSLQIEIPTDEIAAFCRRHHIRQLALFGSALREDFGPDSDLDILVNLNQVKCRDWPSLLMEEELSRIWGRKVDLNTSQFLSRYFRDEVQAEAVMLYNTK